MPVEVKRVVENGSQRNTQDYWEILNKNVVEMKKRPKPFIGVSKKIRVSLVVKRSVYIL